jgi:hypothetical protein
MALTQRLVVLLLSVLSLLVAGTWLALTPASGSPAAPRAGTLIEYHGTASKARLPLRADRLPGAPPDFRAFVKAQLRALWVDLGGSPGCKSSPLITVYAVRTDGFARGGVNTLPRQHCRDAGGGYAAIWAVRKGAWKEVIGTQEVVACARLERFDIPSEIGVHECYRGGEVVPYDHP